MKKIVAAVGVLAAVLAAGCARQATVHSELGSFSATEVALTRPVSYHTLQLAVPSQADVATASAETTPQAALNVCSQVGYECPIDSGTASIELARATTDSGGRINNDGTITRLIDHRLVYALTWQNANCPIMGGAPAKGATTTTLPEVRTCTAVVLVDVAAGKSLGMFQFGSLTK